MGTQYSAGVHYGAIVSRELLDSIAEALYNESPEAYDEWWDEGDWFEKRLGGNPDYDLLAYASTYVRDYTGDYALVYKDQHFSTDGAEFKLFEASSENPGYSQRVKLETQIKKFWLEVFEKEFTGDIGWIVGITVG